MPAGGLPYNNDRAKSVAQGFVTGRAQGRGRGQGGGRGSGRGGGRPTIGNLQQFTQTPVGQRFVGDIRQRLGQAGPPPRQPLPAAAAARATTARTQPVGRPTPLTSVPRQPLRR